MIDSHKSYLRKLYGEIEGILEKKAATQEEEHQKTAGEQSPSEFATTLEASFEKIAETAIEQPVIEDTNPNPGEPKEPEAKQVPAKEEPAKNEEDPKKDPPPAEPEAAEKKEEAKLAEEPTPSDTDPNSVNKEPAEPKEKQVEAPVQEQSVKNLELPPEDKTPPPPKDTTKMPEEGNPKTNEFKDGEAPGGSIKQAMFSYLASTIPQPSETEKTAGGANWLMRAFGDSLSPETGAKVMKAMGIVGGGGLAIGGGVGYGVGRKVEEKKDRQEDQQIYSAGTEYGTQQGARRMAYALLQRMQDPSMAGPQEGAVQ